MSFKKVFVLSLFFLMGLSSSFVIHAAAIECGKLSAARSPGVPTLSLTCGDQNGFVKNEAALDHLKVVVTKSNGQQHVYTLKNPPGGIRDYYAGVEKNPWVINQLRGKLAYGDTVEVSHNGYGLKSGTPLYSDWKAENQIGEVGGGGNSGSKMSCRYTSRPTVITTKACGTFCMSGIDCDINGKKYTGHVFCKADRDGEACPSADKCAEDDPDIPEMKAAINYNEFGDFIVPDEWKREGKAPAGASGGSQSDSSGGNTSAGNDAGSGGTLQ